MLTNQVRLDLSKEKWIKCSTSRYAAVARWLIIYTKVQYFQICSSSYSVTGPLYQSTPFPVNWSDSEAAILDGKKIVISSHQTSRY